MKRHVPGFSRAYQLRLRKYLERGSQAGLQPARALGRQALAAGLGALDLAKAHEDALIALVLPGSSPRVRESTIRRAGAFFAQAIVPIEKAHHTARETHARLNGLNQMLRGRTMALTASNRQLEQEILRRKLAEEALQKSERHYGQLLAQSAQMQEQLRFLSRQLLSAQEEERKRISRELHDVIAQTLTGINVRLTQLKKEAGLNTKGLERNIARTQQLVEKSVNVVHQFARELRPTVLDDLGLIPALHTFMKAFRKETGIHVTLSAFAAVDRVNGDKRTVLYRVAQEALTNVARHARASRADVKMQKCDGAVCLTIKDNGKGFHTGQLLHGNEKRRLGLLGMRERVEMVRGNFHIQSAPGKGTTVRAQIPLTDDHRPGDGKSRDGEPGTKL